MRKRMYIKESVIKNRLQNYLYNSGNIENNFIKILSELGVNEDKYVLRNYNTEDSSFDCKCPNNAYKIRLGSEYANGWNYSTIEITHNDLSINYFYYLNSDLVPSLKIRDFSKEINGKTWRVMSNDDLGVKSYFYYVVHNDALYLIELNGVDKFKDNMLDFINTLSFK
jgi:hypothetical protein